MSRLTNFLIAATVVVALVGCKKDEGSVASSSSYSTDRGNLKVTLNDWQVQSSKTAHVTVTKTGDGCTIGLYNIVPCIPEVLVTGCTEDNGNYTGTKEIVPELRTVKLIATVDAAGMVINVDDSHTGPFVGKKWIIATAPEKDSLHFRNNSFSVEFEMKPIEALRGLLLNRDTAMYLPALNISTTYKHEKLRFPKYWASEEKGKGTKADTLEFPDYLKQSLQPLLRAHLAGIADAGGANIWWYPAQVEYLQFSEYGRCGVQLTDFYNCRAMKYIATVAASGSYIEGADYIMAKMYHDSICGFPNPAAGRSAWELLDPYSQYCILQYGEKLSDDTNMPMIEICTDWLGERIIQMVNLVLDKVLYSSLKIEQDHFDLPIQIIKADDKTMRLGFDQDFLRGVVNNLYEKTKDWDSTKIVNEILPGWNHVDSLMKKKSDSKEGLKLTEKKIQQMKDYLKAFNEYMQQKDSQLEVSLDFELYDPDNKALRPWEQFVVDNAKGEE